MALDLDFLKKKYSEMLGGAANVQNWLESPTSRVNIPVPTVDPVTKSYKSIVESVLTETPKTMYDISKGIAGLGSALLGKDTSQYKPTSAAGKFGQELVTTGIRVGQGQKLSDILGDTVGYYGAGKTRVPLTNIRLPEFGISESTGFNLLKGGVKAFESPLAATGGKYPLQMFGYSLLGGGISAGSNVLFDEKKDPLGSFYRGTMETAEKAPLMVGGMKATAPLTSVGGLPLQSATNVGQGILLDISAGYDTTPESVLLDLIMPGASKVAGNVIKQLKNKPSVKNAVKEIQDTGTLSDKAIIDTVNDINKAGGNVTADEVRQMVLDPVSKQKVVTAVTKSTPEYKPVEQKVLSSDEYVKQLELERGQATKAKGTTVRSVLNTIQNKFEDSFAPITRAFDDAEKRLGVKILPAKDPRYQIDEVLRSNEHAERFMVDNGLYNVIQSVKKEELPFLNNYLIAKHSLEVEKTGKNSGRNIVADQQLVADYGPRYEQIAQDVYKYNRSLLNYLVENNLIDKALADELTRLYPSYVPFKRVFSVIEEEALKPQAGIRAVGSVSRQNVIKKLEGSDRLIEDPLQSMIDNTVLAFRQGEANKTANMVGDAIDAGVIPGKKLRDAENVTSRIELHKEVKDLDRFSRKTQRLVTTRNKWVRDLVSEINKLNKRGLKISLKQNPELEIYKPVTKIIEKTKRVKVTGDMEEFWIDSPITDDTVRQLSMKQPTPTQTKKLVNSLVGLENNRLNLIKRRISSKNKALADMLDTVMYLKKELDDVKVSKKSINNEIRNIADIDTLGKHTFSRLKNGIKETYEVSQEMSNALKNLNDKQLHPAMKILSIPTRILTTGATGLNAPFVMTNVVKDQLFTGITSKHPLYTSILNPFNFVKALYAATGRGEVYDQWARSGGASLMVDIARGADQKSISKIQAKKTAGSFAKYIVTHPSEYLRAVEDIISTGERLTRIQQYIGTKQALLKEGRTAADAEILARNASRFNSANFARRGEYSKFFNAFFPYFNAGIQGSRALRESFVKDPKGTALRFTVTIGTPISAATLWNISSPERKAAYDDIQDYEKENNIIILPPNPTKDERGRWNAITIPMPQGVSNLANIIRRQIEGINGLNYETASTTLNDLLSATTSFALPINEKGTRDFVNRVTPQSAKIILEPAYNINLFTGKRLVPDTMKNLLPEQQVFDWTSGTARMIGKAINVSPIIVEHMIGTVAGGVGKQLLNATDTSLAVGGVIPQEQIGGESILGNVESRFALASGGAEKQRAYDVINQWKSGAERTTAPINIANLGDGKGNLSQLERDSIKYNLEKSGQQIAEINGVPYYVGESGQLSELDLSKFVEQPSDSAMKIRDRRSEKMAKAKSIFLDNVLTNESKSVLLKKMGLAESDIYDITYGVDKVSAIKGEDLVAKVTRDTEAYKAVKNIMQDVNSGILDEQSAQGMFDRMGITADDASYYYLATLDKDIKTAIVMQSAEYYDNRDDWLKNIVSMRKSVNGAMVLSNNVIEDLYDKELITKSERDTLKNLEYKNGEVSFSKSYRDRVSTAESKKLVTAQKKAIEGAVKATAKLVKPRKAQFRIARERRAKIKVKPVTVSGTKVFTSKPISVKNIAQLSSNKAR